MVRATGAQHEEVQRYLDEVAAASRRQVLIEVTIVEVSLSDGYSAGIDWSSLATDAGLSIVQDFAGGVAQGLGASPFFALTYADSRNPLTGQPNGDITGSVSLLKQFGDTRVLSSPKVMALNNQTALLKVVQNIVYFEVSSDTSQAQTTSVTTFSTEARSVSVGVVMSVTPQINATDEVTLIIRPTISRVTSSVQDPNPDLFDASTGFTIPNLIPQIAVREMESVLRIGSGQLAILGGLMTDDVKKNSDAIPWLSNSETFGDLFTSRSNEFEKTELVIFIRPWVIRTPDVQADLRSFEPFLPENIDPSAEPVTSRFAKDLP
jgi:general secretion pathway protein D